jgi:hypothetical protein
MTMYDSMHPARERIITMEIMKLERRQASERAHARAGSGPRAGSGKAAHPGAEHRSGDDRVH